MSVVVKGMKMPRSCSECRFFNDAWCLAFETEDWRNAYNKPIDGERLHNCPLVELPKHGRLIDADALKNDLLYDVAKDTEYLGTSLSDNERENIQFDKDCKQNCASYVSDAPTVLEADE